MIKILHKGVTFLAASDTTKLAIVSGLKELACKKSFEKVSVIEISNICGINRNTFYYHFDDKYAVISWIFKTEIKPVLNPYMEVKNWSECIISLCNHLKSEKHFYTNVLYDRTPGSLYQILVDYFKKAFMDAFADHYKRLNITGDDREIVARFYSHGTIDMICDWVMSGMRADAVVSTNILNLAIKAGLFNT